MGPPGLVAIAGADSAHRRPDGAFLANGLADDRERLLTDFAVRHDVIGVAQIKLVDLATRHEFLDVDDPLAFDRDRLEFLRLDLDIFAFGDLVALDDVGVIDFVAGVGVDLFVANAVAGFFVDLVEADFFPLGRRRK